jgi:transcriptional regulator with XRE-family HTH domain
MEMSMDEVIANNVRKLRTSQSMSQGQFANAVGVTRSIITNIELSRRTSLQVLEQIARAFGVSVADLVQADPALTISLLNKIEGLDLDSELEALPPDIQSKIPLIVRCFTDREVEGVRAKAKQDVVKALFAFIRAVHDSGLDPEQYEVVVLKITKVAEDFV